MLRPHSGVFCYVGGLLSALLTPQVKTVGDSFMVVFGSAEDALRFAMETQQRLLLPQPKDWPSSLLMAFECRMEWSKGMHRPISSYPPYTLARRPSMRASLPSIEQQSPYTPPPLHTARCRC